MHKKIGAPEKEAPKRKLLRQQGQQRQQRNPSITDWLPIVSAVSVVPAVSAIFVVSSVSAVFVVSALSIVSAVSTLSSLGYYF